MIAIVTLTLLFAAIYWIITHQTVYFGREIVFISVENLAVIYALLLIGTIAKGKARFLRPFLVAAALYLTSDVVILNLQMYYPISVNKVFLLILLISIAIVVSDLPKRYLTSFVGFILSAISVYELIYPYNSTIAIALAIVLSYLGITALASGFESVLAKGIAGSRVYVILALIAYAILEFAKPYLKGGLFDFAEWLIVALAAFFVFRNFKPEYDENRLTEHVSQVSKVFDELSINLDRAAEAFVKNGEKSMLVTCLARVLLNSGYREVEVASIISPIVNYCEEKMPILSFPWEKKITEVRSRKKREKIIEYVKKYLKGDSRA